MASGERARLRPGRHNAISDIPGIELGHATDQEALTGATVVLARAGAVAGVDVRGSAPGTRETDLLEPGNLVQKAQAILLTGGSAYGLAAASGVMRYLEENGLGQVVAEGRVVPIVPAAALFDLDIGSWEVRPGELHGYEAASSAGSGRPAMGNVGAGTGAKAGGVKGGVGSASALMEDGLVVGALAAVNSAGRAFDPDTGAFYARHLELDGEFGLASSPGREQRGGEGAADSGYLDLLPDGVSRVGRNTTLGVVATNAALDKAQARKLAQVTHDGMARALRPVHTIFDGDTIFAMATGERELTGPWQQARLAAVAADVFARAVVHGMLAARGAGGVPSYHDLFPQAFAGGNR